jgi:hypothetical protein
VFAALCIKVDITSEDNYDSGVFSGILAALQFIGPIFTVYQMIMQRRNKKTNMVITDTFKSVLGANDAFPESKYEFTEMIGHKDANKIYSEEFTKTRKDVCKEHGGTIWIS